MRNTTIDFYKVQKRKIALENCFADNTDNKRLLTIATSSVFGNKSSMKLDLEKFMEGCSDSLNANKYYRQCISIIEQLSNSGDMPEYISSLFAENVVPYIIGLENVKDIVEGSDCLNDVCKNTILTAIKENKICDRVLNNTSSIGKRYDLEKIIVEKRNYLLSESVFDCCKLIDTYQMPPYGKMNVALEQLSYFLQKNAIEYDKKNLVNNVSEYFLLSNNSLKDGDIKGFRSVLEENIFLEDEDIQDSPIMNTDSKGSIQDKINQFMMRKEKCLTDVADLMDSIMDNYDEIHKSEVVREFNLILEFLRILHATSTIRPEELSGLLPITFDLLKKYNLTREQIGDLICQVKAEISIVEKITLRTEDSLYNDYLANLKDGLDILLDIESGIYSSDKIHSDIAFEAAKNTTEPEYLNEFKIFKFNNLIRAALEIDKFLRRKSFKLTNFLKNKTKNIFNKAHKFFAEDGSIMMDNFTEDNNIDICLAVYEVNKEEDISEMHNVMNELCNYLNEHLELPKSSRVSYQNNGSIFEIHLEDVTYVIMDEKQEELKENSISEYDAYNCGLIIENAKAFENLYNIIQKSDKVTVTESVQSNLKKNNYELDRLIYMIDAMQYVNLYNKKDVDDIVYVYNCEHYNDYIGNSKLNYALNTWERRNYDIFVQLEAVEVIQQALDEKVDLANIKLSLEGLKKKVKDLGTKEKEASRNLDATMNHFMSSMKQAMTTDRRESIIKGSVIPSFSKCVKIGIALAGLGLATGNPLIPAIAALGGLGVSKSLNRKERLLLLDEIDIELKIVDKELSIAENNNNMKKYRELMQYQKKLQREKQRIKYNIKQGHDLPDSTIGTSVEKD